jgi:hypothetical protein
MYDTKLAGVKVYLRQTRNFRAHAVSACIGLWCHGAMHEVCACISLWCMHQPVMSQAHHMVAACTYCMGSKVSSLSRIYLYPSYFDRILLIFVNIAILISSVCLKQNETTTKNYFYFWLEWEGRKKNIYFWIIYWQDAPTHDSN